MPRVLIVIVAAAAAAIAACSKSSTPVSPGPAGISGALHEHAGSPSDHNSAADGDKGYIKGWFEGEEVELYYTKSYFCAEPPESAATTGCELGAPAEIEPRPGPLPLIYAIAAAGIPAPPSTLACLAGTPCLNHPGMIDASRVGLSPTAGPVPHSHILTERTAGWHRTVNVRVRDLARWNQIAAAKSIDKVREFQMDGSGLVSPDTPTNIFFFIASWR
jgi:hypothetical protein